MSFIFIKIKITSVKKKLVTLLFSYSSALYENEFENVIVNVKMLQMEKQSGLKNGGSRDLNEKQKLDPGVMSNILTE